MPMRTNDRADPKPVLRILLWGTIAALLIVPLVAMQLSSEVSWNAADFVVAGVLLVGGGLAFEIAAGRLRDRRSRIAATTGIFAIVALLWAEGAVGIF